MLATPAAGPGQVEWESPETGPRPAASCSRPDTAPWLDIAPWFLREERELLSVPLRQPLSQGLTLRPAQPLSMPSCHLSGEMHENRWYR